jgi:hypothetical protein
MAATAGAVSDADAGGGDWDDEDEDPFGAMADADEVGLQDEISYQNDEPPEILEATQQLCAEEELETCMRVLMALQVSTREPCELDLEVAVT